MKFTDDMLFAHPILSADSGDFLGASFEASFEYTIESDDRLALRTTITLNCSEILDLVNSGKAGCGFFLICRPTYINRLIEMTPGTKTHIFDARDFFGTLQLRPIVWTKEEVRGWRSASLHTEYAGFADLPSAGVLALADEQRFSIDRQRLRPFESIFALVTAERLEAGQLAVDLDGEKITINVSAETKRSIEGIRNSAIGRHVLLNAVYLPAVMQVLREVSADRGQYAGRAWFRILAAKCDSAGVKIEDPDLLHDAQRLLAWPFRLIQLAEERLFS